MIPGDRLDPLPAGLAIGLAKFAPLVQQVNLAGQSLGVIDWGRKIIVAEGRSEQQGKGPQAEAMAKRGASLVALRNAAALAGGVRFGPGGRVANIRSGVIAKAIQAGDVQRIVVREQHYHAPPEARRL